MNRAARYRLRRVEVLASAQFGCVGGALAALPLGLFGGWLVRLALAILRHTLEGWQRVPFEAGPLGPMPLDVVSLLRLNGWLESVQILDNAPLLVVLGATLVIMLLFGSFGSLLAGLGALIYNAIAVFSGGLAIDLEGGE